MNKQSNASGVAQETFNYSSDTDIDIRIRKSSSGSTRYFPINTTGTITTNGFSLTAVMTEDDIASTQFPHKKYQNLYYLFAKIFILYKKRAILLLDLFLFLALYSL